MLFYCWTNKLFLTILLITAILTEQLQKGSLHSTFIFKNMSLRRLEFKGIISQFITFDER